MGSLPLLDAIVAMTPADGDLHLAFAASRRHRRGCHLSSLRALSDALVSTPATRWWSRNKLRGYLAALVATVSDQAAGAQPNASANLQSELLIGE